MIPKIKIGLWVFLVLTLTRNISHANKGRPHAAIVVGTHHYSAEKTMPRFGIELERLGFRNTLINPSWDPEKDPRGLPGLEVLADADMAIFFVHFLALKGPQREHFTDYVESGKPVVGFRTSTHAFNYPISHANHAWNEDFGRDVLGTRYQIHLAGSTTTAPVPEAKAHPILTGIGVTNWQSSGTLYFTKPQPGITPLLISTRSPKGEKAVVKTNRFGTHNLKSVMTDTTAWTWRNKWQGRTFATSLGHVSDFAHPRSMRVMVNGVFWAAGTDTPNAHTDIRTFKEDPKKKAKPKRKLAETLPPLVDGHAPQTVEAMWAGFDPRAEPMETEVLHVWEEDEVILKVIRYRMGIFKGRRADMAAIYGYPKNGKALPALVQIHGGGQYADYRAVLTNAKRGYATISISWAGRIHAPNYNVNPSVVRLFWDKKKEDPLYKLTTDWGALDGYHAPSRNPKNGFADTTPKPWTLDTVDSPRNNPWFLATLGARRALTFLEQQVEVDPNKLGVYGHSMGGKLTVLTAAADDRVKAAAPSCGGISNRNTDNALYNVTVADDVNLKRINCPIIFLSPSNDFHGRIDDLPKSIAEIGEQAWRVTCSAHINHQDHAAFQITGLLWFDQHLKQTFRYPQTPKVELTLKTKSGTPAFTVYPDLSKPIQSVEVYYTQHGQPQGEKHDRENTMSRFWRHAAANKEGTTWRAPLPLMSTNKPLWVYANVLYTLDSPQSGAGYYYAPYTAKSFNLSSLVKIASPEALQAADIKPGIKKNSQLIESFEGDWKKEWFTYDLDHWSCRTHKVYDAQWHTTEGSRLAVDVRAAQANTLVVRIDDYATDIQLTGDDAWQTIELVRDDFKDASYKHLTQWAGIRQLCLTDKDSLRIKKRGNQQEHRRTLGTPWKGPKPTFRNLRWVR